jgi:ubiquinone biosynthesis accessory factor UbiK
VHWDGAGRVAMRPALVRALIYLWPMIDRRFFDELSERINEALRNSPAPDIEKNMRALLAAWFDRLDLVLREDFEVQKKLLERAQAKLAELEARIAELESRTKRPE